MTLPRHIRIAYRGLAAAKARKRLREDVVPFEKTFHLDVVRARDTHRACGAISHVLPELSKALETAGFSGVRLDSEAPTREHPYSVKVWMKAVARRGEISRLAGESERLFRNLQDGINGIPRHRHSLNPA